MNSLVNQATRMATKVLKPFDNKVVGTTARVALILYASLIAPELPEVVARQFDNIFVRGVLIFLIAYLSIKDPVTAALATMALMVTVMSLQRREVQNILGGAANLAGKVVDTAEDVVEGVYDVADTLTGGLLDRAVGTVKSVFPKGKAPAAEPKEQAMAAPEGLEAGMDTAGSF